MSIEVGCFPEHIIGLTRNTCECFDVDDTESISGFYIDEGEGMNLRILDAVNDCESGSLNDMMKWAREEAIRIFKTDIMRGISASRKVQPRVPNWAGMVGGISHNRVIAVSGALAGVRQIMKPLRGGIMRVKQIATMFGASGSFNLGLYNNMDSGELEVIAVQSVANSLKWNPLATPLELPMYQKGINYLEYFWLYGVDQSRLPRNGDIHCDCGSTPLWTYPQCRFEVSQEKYNWSRWSMAAGVQGNDFNERIYFASSTDKNYGIALDVEFFCNVYETLCAEANGHNFDNDSAAADMAQTIRMKACELLLGKILMTSDVNPYTSQGSEMVAQIAGQQRADYITNLESLVDYLTSPDHINDNADCFECKSSSGFKLSGIYS